MGYLFRILFCLCYNYDIMSVLSDRILVAYVPLQAATNGSVSGQQTEKHP